MSTVGYGRVSTRDQHPESQLDALTAARCVPIFIDHGVSGVKASRPELDACLAFLRPGDTLVITRLDRLGRSLANLVKLGNDLRESGIDLHVTEQSIDTSTSMGRFFFNVVGAFAEMEHDIMTERTRDGLAAAKARGRLGGRKPVHTPEQAKQARRMHAEDKLTAEEIGQVLGMSRATVYRMLKSS